MRATKRLSNPSFLLLPLEQLLILLLGCEPVLS